MSQDGDRLRLVTYMCPSHPVELYMTLLEYLEEALGCKASLIYESRAPGPLPDREDPFTTDSVDLAFMTSAAWDQLADTENSFAELLPVTPAFKHPLNKHETPGYYSDIIVHTDTRKHVKEFLDLRGCQWAYSNDSSLSGSAIVLKNLRELGENSSFFGNIIKSESHLAAALMVQQKQVEAAAVDANTLAYYRFQLPDHGRDISVLTSLGPLPPYPIVVNSRLSDLLKNKLCTAFLNMTSTSTWSERMYKFGITTFAKNSTDEYKNVKELKESVKNTAIGVPYY